MITVFYNHAMTASLEGADATLDPTAPRQTFLWLWTATFLCFTAFYGGAQPLAQVMARSALTGAETAAVLGAFGATALALRPLAGWLTDRVAPRWVIGGGAAALALGVGGLPWASGAAPLIGLRALQAIGYVAVTTAGTTAAAGLGPATARAGRIARFGMAANLAMLLTPIGLSLAPVGAGDGVAVLAGLALAAAFCAQPLDDLAPRTQGGSIRVAAAVRRVGLWPWFVALSLGLSFGAFLQYTPLLEGLNTGGLFSLYGAAILLTRLLAGGRLDRVSLGRTAVIAGLLLCGGLATLALPTTVRWFGALAIGAGGGMLHPAALAAAVKRVPDAAGQATAWSYVGFDLGLALSGWALGPLFAWGGATLVFAATAGFMALIAGAGGCVDVCCRNHRDAGAAGG